MGAIDQPARLFDASGRHSVGTAPCLIHKTTLIFLNHAFPHRSTLIRGDRFGQPNTAMQPTPSVGAILLLGGRASTEALVMLVLFCRARLMAIRWAACGVGTNACVGAIHQSARLSVASSRHSGGTARA